MRRSRPITLLPATTAAVTGLIAGTLLMPVVLSLLGREDGMMPPVAFITAAALCWVLVPRIFVEVLAARAARGTADQDGAEEPSPAPVPVRGADPAERRGAPR